jgi:hypothetical protein
MTARSKTLKICLPAPLTTIIKISYKRRRRKKLESEREETASSDDVIH